MQLHIIDRRDLRTWAQQARPGDRLEYAYGTDGFAYNNMMYTHTMVRAQSLQEEGGFVLFQKRDKWGETVYIIQGVSPRAAKFIERIAK